MRIAIVLMVFLAGCQTPLKTSDLSGTVTSAKGPEAGVWVIAETTDLPTRFAKIVVTDERGRYSLPDMPAANYQVWVRGYGLVDSPKMQARPRKSRTAQSRAPILSSIRRALRRFSFDYGLIYAPKLDG